MAVIPKKPALPPKIEVTPNPLADVNPSPAQNRNSAISKTGAVLPFVNPNQPQVDLATPKGALPGVPSVVGGVTAGAVSAPPQRIDYADLWWAAQARKDITYEQYVDAIYERNSLSRWTLPPVGKLPTKAPPTTGGGLPPVAPPVAPPATGGGLPPVIGGGTAVQLTPPGDTPTKSLGASPAGPGAETPEEELKRLQRELSALQLAGEDDSDYQVSIVDAMRSLEDRITQLFNQQHPSTLPPILPEGPVEEPEKEGPTEDPELDKPSGYVDKDGNSISNRVLQGMDIAWALANGYIRRAGDKGPAGGIMDWIDKLPDWLRNILIPGTGNRLNPASLTDAQLKEGLAALAGRENDPTAKSTIKALQDEKTRRDQGKGASEAEAAVKALGLDAYGVTAEEFAKYTPDQFLQVYNHKGSKMTDVQLRGFLETWQKRNPSQKIPVPTDKNSRAYQFYQTMKTFAAAKAGALFAPEAAGPAGTVTSQQITDYVNRLRSSSVLPKTADEAYDWLQQPLEPPPGLVDTKDGWLNADGSPPTPEQQRALNAYISRLDTQPADREAAYRLIAATEGQVAANNARQKDYENDEEARKAAEWRAEEGRKAGDVRAEEARKASDWRAEEGRKAGDVRAEEARKASDWRAEEGRKAGDVRAEEARKASDARVVQAGIEAEQRLESRTISAEQRAEATRIAAEGRAASARIVDEARQEGRVTAAEQRAIQAGIAAETRLESRTISAEQRAEATRIAAEGRAIQAQLAEEVRAEEARKASDWRAEEGRKASDARAVQAGIEAEQRLESRTISAEQRAEATRIATEGRAATTRIKQRASGGTPVGAEATASYRTSLRGFTAVPTTLEEAKGWLGQTLPAPPGLTYDATTNQWVDESGNLPTGDRAQAVQDYEFQQSQYGKNRERADAIVKSYTDLDAVQRGRDAAEAALQRALGTKDVMEQVELTYLLDKAELDLKETQRKSQMVQAYVALTNNPSTAARMKSLGLLDQFNRDTGMNVTVPDKVSKDKVFAMIPSLGDWANMSPQQQMDALEMLSARTGWMPEELAALMSEVAGAPGGFRGGGVSSSTVARSR